MLCVLIFTWLLLYIAFYQCVCVVSGQVLSFRSEEFMLYSFYIKSEHSHIKWKIISGFYNMERKLRVSLVIFLLLKVTPSREWVIFVNVQNIWWNKTFLSVWTICETGQKYYLKSVFQTDPYLGSIWLSMTGGR